MKHNFPALFALGLSLGWSGICYGGPPFGVYNRPESLFCDRQDIQGAFSFQDSSYTSRGACNMLRARDQSQKRGESKFTDFNNAEVLYRINWTAKGGYNPTTRATWEEVTVPAPRVDEPSPPGRPYGRFRWESICDKDPWLEFSARCSQPRMVATGNLEADVQKTLAFTGRPFTSEMKPPQREALASAQKKNLSDRAKKGEVIPGSTSGSAGGFIQMFPTKPSAGTKPAPAPSAPQQTATAKNDVDIYNGPGGQYKVIGMMRQGQKASVHQRHQDGWYELGLPGARGWVAQDHLTVSQ